MPSDLTINLSTGKPIEYTPSAVAPNKDVVLSQDLMQAYATGDRAMWIEGMQACREFAAGMQWTAEEKYALQLNNQMPTIVNMTQYCVDQGVGLLTYNKPRWTAVGRDDSDRRIAKMFADGAAYIWDISSGNMETKQAITDYYVSGIGYLHLYYDPKDKEVKFRSLEPMDVFVDPNSKDRFFRDAAHIILRRRMTAEQLQERYPEIWQKLRMAQTKAAFQNEVGQQNDGNIKLTPVQDQTHPSYEVLLRYTKLITPQFHTLDRSTGVEGMWMLPEYKEYIERPACILHSADGPTYLTHRNEVEYWYNVHDTLGPVVHEELDEESKETKLVPGPENHLAIPKSERRIEKVKYAHLIKLGVIDVRQEKNTAIQQVFSVGDVLVSNMVIKSPEYPIVPIPNRWSRNPYPVSDVNEAIPINKELNKTRSIIQSHFANTANVKVLIPRGSISKEKLQEAFRTPGFQGIEIDMELGTPVVVGPTPLSGEAYNYENNLKEDIQRVFGIFELMGGNPKQAQDTYRGTMLMDELGQRKMKSKRDDIEEALNHMGRVIVAYMQAYWTEEKVIRVVEPNNAPRQTTVNQNIYDSVGTVVGRLNDISVANCDLVYVSGSMLPSNRWAQFEYYERLFKLGAIDQIELLKKSDMVDVEGVLERSSHIRQLEQMLQSAQEEIKKLAGDLQTFERETTQARIRVEVEKFKARLAEMLAKMKADQQVSQNKAKTQLELFGRGLNQNLEQHAMALEQERMANNQAGGE